MVKYKIKYIYDGKEFCAPIISMDLVSKTAKVIHPEKNVVLELPYIKSSLIEFTKYYSGGVAESDEQELYEGDIVYVPGYWKGVIKRYNNIFVIALDNENNSYINMHEMYSEEKVDAYGTYCVIPSLRKKFV